MKLNKILIITHANCMDGCCCAAILKSKYEDEAKYLALDHSNLDENKDLNASKYIKEILNQKNSKVIISDFCLPVWMLEKLLEQGNKVVVIDHHADNYEKLSGFMERQKAGEQINLEVYFSRDNSESGAMLTWKYLNNKNELKKTLDGKGELGGIKTSVSVKGDEWQNIPLAVEHVSAGDVWQFKLGLDTKYFYTGLLDEFSEPKCVPYEVWKQLLEDPGLTKKYIELGAPIYEQFMAEMREYAKIAKKVTINGQDGMIVFAPKKYTSDLGNYLAKNGADFGLVCAIEAGIVRSSLRSVAPKTVNNLAKIFGGGGHPQASAFRSKSLEEFKSQLAQQGNDVEKLFKALSDGEMALRAAGEKAPRLYRGPQL